MNLSSIVGLLLAAIVAAGAAVVFALLPGIKQDNAIDELTTLATASSRALYSMGAANVTSCAVLITNGYLSSKVYPACTKANVYSNDITVVGVAASLTATITYAFNTAAQCAYAVQNLPNRVTELTTAPSCTGAVLTFGVPLLRQ